MKVRIYYEGYNDKYIPQYKRFGFWRTFTEFECSHGYYCDIKQRYSTKNEAIDYLNDIKAQRQERREQEAAAKERSKKSGVVYEDVI